MKREIRATFLGLSNVAGIYGMGSFFRNESSFSDVDVLVVVKSAEAAVQNPSLWERARSLEAVLGIRVDLTVLTLTEFASRPLRDMDSLVDLAAPDEHA